MAVSGYGSRPDAELEGLAAGGDREAFAELYGRHFDRVCDFSLRLVRDADEAADVTQETFLKVMAALKPKEKRAAFTTLILTIARNTALNRLRARRGAVAWPSLAETEQRDVIYRELDTSRLGSPEAATCERLVEPTAAAVSRPEHSFTFTACSPRLWPRRSGGSSSPATSARRSNRPRPVGRSSGP